MLLAIRGKGMLGMQNESDKTIIAPTAVCLLRIAALLTFALHFYINSATIIPSYR